MLLLYLIIELAVATLADPFHKYPYVFLLDVGNEEIEKTTTEQIRLTIPGGSLALKYPATGDGETIGHVRVSGIDFGTDLKANIVQGGPGYKYVVLVFMGNPGVTYDAVVTIQTVPNIDDSNQIVSNMDSSETNQDLADENQNNSAEDTSDTETKLVYSENKNAQKMQSSSNIYEYVSNEVVDTQNSEDDDDSQNSSGDESKDVEDEIQDTKSDDNSDDINENVDSNEDYDEDESNNGNNHVYSLNDNRYGKYEAFNPIIIGGVRFYPQAAVYMQGGYSKPTYDQVNHNDEDGNDDNEINDKDTNNNDDTDYGSPVDY
nr:uncharacterized protein DDB_G0290685-like [Vanessa tameamea]